MSWIRVAVGLVRHPKTGRLARALHTSRTDAVGILVGLWDYAHLYHIDGKIDPADWPESAETVCIADHAGLLAALKDSGFVDTKPEGDFFHDWDEYQGVEILRRQANRERMRKARAGEKEPVLNTLPPRVQNVQGHGRTDVRTDKLHARAKGGRSRAAGMSPRAPATERIPTPMPDSDRSTTAPKPIAETMAELRARLIPGAEPPTNGTDPHA